MAKGIKFASIIEMFQFTFEKTLKKVHLFLNLYQAKFMNEQAAVNQSVVGWFSGFDVGTAELVNYSSVFIEQNGPMFFSLLLAVILFGIVAYRNA
jgi:hypothetical protein